MAVKGREEREERERLREVFRPDEIVCLFIGESPPRSGGFFYAGESILLEATRDAFYEALPATRQGRFLERFRDCGCYLEDLCLDPVSQWASDDPRRLEARRAGEESLAARLGGVKPRHIFVVMEAIGENARRSLESAGLGSTPMEFLPFPRDREHTQQYGDLLRESLGRLRDGGILLCGHSSGRRAELQPLVSALARHQVEWVLAGSVAALAWYPGPWPFVPGDLDVVPERSPENLRRLSAALGDLEAKPVHEPGWSQSLSLQECAAWRPEPANEENLDHLFETRFGRLDVVLRRAGLYEDLLPRCGVIEAWKGRVHVAHPEDLAATMRRTKGKHEDRSDLMTAIHERARRGKGPVGLVAP